MNEMIASWRNSSSIADKIYIPKYYDDTIQSGYDSLKFTHSISTIGELQEAGIISLSTGHEIGKAAYGTGDIPFVRTSDIVNWEIKTAPKQGVSQEIYEEYASKQNVEIGDILLVRDGTYLIGRNCFVTAVDQNLIFQSHVLNIKVLRKDLLSPELLFLALNSPLVQKEIRSKQFTADIIDTLGQRVKEVRIPLPRDEGFSESLIEQCRSSLKARSGGKALIKQMPILVEESLLSGDSSSLDAFAELSVEGQIDSLVGRTVTSEFGEFNAQWVSSESIENSIYLPKYYDHNIAEELDKLKETCELWTIGALEEGGMLEISAGVEPGKQAYGTGEIPFIRTSDFSNWEIAALAKQGVSEEIYEEHRQNGAVATNDVLLVRDGTYLVGSSCIVTESDSRALHSGGLLRIRCKDGKLSPYLLLALLNSFIVKRQLRSKQFTRDVIDTLGRRYLEVILPIPRKPALREALETTVELTVTSRINARDEIGRLAKKTVSSCSIARNEAD